MKLRTRWILTLAMAAVCSSGQLRAQDVSSRAIKICVAADALPDVMKAAQAILAAAPTSSVLQAMGGNAEIINSKDVMAMDVPVRAYNHLILVGLPDDPLIQLAWQREAKVEDGGFYIFDFGHLKGDIGYIESDRNPFLHSPDVGSAPFETEIVTITGSTPAAVGVAAGAFLKQGLVNGVVAPSGWQRPKPTILDHDPLDPNFVPPAFAPAKVAEATLVGVTQGGESEYRGVLQDTGNAPAEIWRFKYLVPGAWDGAGLSHARSDYLAGLHRRANGNTLWVARFADPSQAAAAMDKIGAAAKLDNTGQGWSGTQPFLADAPEDKPGPLVLWQHGAWLVMSTVPQINNDSLLAPDAK